MLRRFGVFFLVNMAVMLTISFLTGILGLNRYLTAQGIDYQMLFWFCLVWGMGGSFISLLLSKVIAKWSMGLQILDKNNRDPEAAWLYQTVQRLSRSARLPAMPEVAIYNSPDVNAFATGPSKGNSLVAVSTGLLQSMNRDEAEAVLAHEVSHIANGDMVTMTLIQGVINAFVMFFAKIVAWAAANALRGDNENKPSYMLAWLIEMVLYIVFGLLGSIVVNWFSRQREFRADAGAARLAGAGKMISALKRLKVAVELPQDGKDQLACMKISGKKASLSALFSTHPSLDERIRRLQ